MKKGKKFLKFVIIILIVCLIVGVYAISSAKPTEYRTFVAMKSDIEKIVSGSGTIAASKSRKEYAKVSAEIKKMYFEEGDSVKAGDILMVLDSDTYMSNIKSQNIAIQQSQLSKNTITQQISDLKIVANAPGYISDLLISEGSYVANTSPICDIVKNGVYEVTLQFVYNENSLITVGNTAVLTLMGSYSNMNGTVTKVSDMRKAITGNAQVVEVTIEVPTPGFSLDGIEAKGEVYTGVSSLVSVNQSKFTLVKQNTVRAKSMGTVKSLNVSEGSYVNYGDVIAVLENTDLSTNLQNINLSLQNQYNQLSLSKDQLDNYQIVAQMDGVITYWPFEEGDMVQAGTLLATVSNKETMEFKIPVDELDVAKLDYNQIVNVSIDAIPETEIEPLEGKIKMIPLEGTTTSGVTDYYVTIELPGNDDIRISMSANADIIVDSQKDILVVPIDSVKTDEDGTSYVEVLGKDETGKKDIAIRKDITTGVSDSTYIEVTSGLSEGEEVIVPSTSTLHMSTGAMRQMTTFGQ
ncbi:MAG: efflux RND transporter periplasmic adaptor subunit [Clostridia bacterium]|nr:efflux RND transporter periplasmic adaptor subunit [Clostridia bacterium]